MLLLTLLALAVAPQDAGPLEPARGGRVQCYGPDAAQKTCNAIGSYRFQPDGVIWNDARNMIGADPAIVLQASGKVYVRDGAECARSVDRAKEITGIDVNGVPLEGQMFESARRQIADNMQTLLGSGEFCSTFHANPDGTLRAVVTVDGVERPEFESTVLWIDPAEGWTLVAPPGTP